MFSFNYINKIKYKFQKNIQINFFKKLKNNYKVIYIKDINKEKKLINYY